MKHLIGYLRECYREDNSRAGIWNVFTSNVQHQIFLDGSEQLARGFLADVHLPPARAGQALQFNVSRRRETQLLYGTLFVTGSAPLREGDAPRKICAPLILFPASIVLEQENEVATLRIETSGRRLNGSLIDLLDAEDAGLLERIDDEMSGDALTEGDVLRIAAVLEELVPGMDTSPAAAWPRLDDREAVEQTMKEKHRGGDQWKLVSAACVAVFPQAEATRGLLTELDDMATQEPFVPSPPLSVLLGGEPLKTSAPKAARAVPIWAPAVLSEAQEKILLSARTNPITIAIGPPGTGKSFTIASLALDHMARGESVLISSRMDHAVDVVADKVAAATGSSALVVRAGRAQYLKDIQAWLDELLSGMHTARPVDSDRLHALSGALARVDREMHAAERAVRAEQKRHRSWGRAMAFQGGSVWSRIWRWHIRRQLGGRPLALGLHLERLQELLTQRVAIIKEVLEISRRFQMKEALQKDRLQLVSLNKALRSRNSARQEAYFKSIDFSHVFRALPIWLVNTADVHRVLPLQPGLFDLVILDESSQCDMASALPLIQRAKRVLIAGDPKQLRHLSFLSLRRQARLQEQFGFSEEEKQTFDYRRTSLLDLVRSRVHDQCRVGFLNEHYRSRLSIIAFSNREFYRDSLHIMTEGTNRDHGRCEAARLHVCQGERGETGANLLEAEALVDTVRSIIQSSRESGARPPTIGVLSPFRNQVTLLQELLQSRVAPEEWTRLTGMHELLTGTAHTFQGEERDIMLLSLTVDERTSSATLRFLEKPDVFNVSITRAREFQHVFISRAPESLPRTSLLGRYCHYLRQVESGGILSATRQQMDQPPDALKLDWLDQDVFSTEIIEALTELGMNSRRSIPIAGLSLDVVVFHNGNALGIDLIGFPGQFEEMIPLERYRMFYRANLRMMPLSYAEWLVDRQRCLGEIVRRLS